MTNPTVALSGLVADALAQADELHHLDAPRAEAWASDLLALAAEVLDTRDPSPQLVDAFVAVADDRAATILCALGGLLPDAARLDWNSTAPPVWAGAIGSSRCEGAWTMAARGATSVALLFVDSADVGHVVSVDLIPGAGGGPEQVGEVAVGPGDLLDATYEEDASIESVEASPETVAARIAAALAVTERPTESAVANARLLAARLGGLTEAEIVVPMLMPDEMPHLPARDPEDDAYARDMLRRAVGEFPAVEQAGITAAAARLRAAAAADEPIARWLAASLGPVDLDTTDLEVVVAALAAAVAPFTLAPLEVTERDAVLTLEWADWLGAVIDLVRAGEGAAVDGESLVDAVNRCAEVTSTIPKSDRARIAWAFDVCTGPWAPLGLAGADGLTVLGTALLPRALDQAWSPGGK